MNSHLRPRLTGNSKLSSRWPLPIGYPKVWRRVLFIRERAGTRLRLRQHSLGHRLEAEAAGEETEEEGQSPGPRPPCSMTMIFKKSGRLHV